MDGLEDKVDIGFKHVAEKFGELTPRVESLETNHRLERRIDTLSNEFKQYAENNNRAVESMSKSIVDMNTTIGKHMERMAAINEENMRMKGEAEKEKYEVALRQERERATSAEKRAEDSKLQNVILRLWAPLLAFLMTFGGILWAVFHWVQQVSK